MKKGVVFCMITVLLISLSLTACNFNIAASGNEEDQIAQTLVSMAFTQTAMSIEPELEITTPPPEVGVEDVEEEVALEETASPVEIIHNLIPGEPGWINKWFYDTDSSSGSVTGGDDYVANLYERPFTEGDMVYRPDIDINKAEMSEDNSFYYLTLYLHGNSPDGNLGGSYGVEIDINRDGRGDLLVIAHQPSSSEWDITGVSVYKDPNKDVGGASIMRPDSAYTGDGYEQVLFSDEVLDDPDTAWARVANGSSPSVTIAFKKALIGSTSTFVWGVWASTNLLDPALIDLHDNFNQQEAGSPYQSHSTYPLGALNLVDNTCRETYKFEAETPIPGLCYRPEESQSTDEPILTETEQPPDETDPPPDETDPPPDETDPPPDETAEPTGNINGVAFDDGNNDGDRDSGEPITVYTIAISLHNTSCANAAIANTNSKTFNFSGLVAGTYCVKITGGGTMTTPSQYVVSLPAGASRYVEFGFYVIQ